MKTSIATVSLSGDLPEKLDAIARAQFTGVEIFENDFLTFDHSPATVGRMVRDKGLTVTLFQPFRDFEGMPEPLRSRGLDRAERKFDLMQELGADLLLICSNVSPHALGGVSRAADDLRELGERAAKRGLRIGFEALAWGRFVNDHRDAWEIVRRADHPAVGLILDSFHTLARGIDVASIRSIPSDRIFLVQLADAPKLELDLLSWSRHFRNMPGQGDLPVTAFMDAIWATGYDGVVSLEIFNDQFRAGSARAVAVDGKRSLVYLADQLGQLDAADSIPPRAICRGVEFIEFALNEATIEEFRNLIGALGFHLAGRHRSKQVELWCQGDVNLVLNYEREGFAHTFYLTHGPSVCAWCLKVADADAAERRASGLLALPFRQAVGLGELEMPAVRGVGGSLVYFVDDNSGLTRWRDIDFEAANKEDHSPVQVGITNVDHLSQSMEYDEMLSWLLYYGSILDLNKTDGQDVADPGGLVRSQVIQNDERSLRIVLNGSQSRRTLSGRFLNEFLGSGTQHIALATKDIFATVAALQSRGFSPLPIPANYYDDLIARFGLDDDLIARLRQANILYDRDTTGGEYFQCYTKVFAERFFFEIVERRGYDGYGAANAPFRLASQSRLSHRPEGVA
ncbi:sugar phosphate isomerase/epimerase and 4-hydroxyphenylpyruvate domain-containing protein [Acidisoma cellulosilytica]|uniref:3-dehydroshikimate dehydratase n=1 Tax=Acidisoma cellulosilyticum TaxID=2802395 RepID=A0A963Z2Q3_9PROT|nr:sugar phosphate isomerase/epimerase and 4-hydroxyphenylpyruvate domain-containing protein [Acidisoma cellulosilyticum]MCB8881526.1 sugar phosphate isomerase/epimerase and 4-hydroxyphenylpyruvate domain-containing protein [Acidisoma cellulosilyticum]